MNSITAAGDLVVGFIDANFPPNKQPGRTTRSFGVSCEGKAWHDSQSTEAFSQKAVKGSRLGAGINFATRDIFFTMNGKLLNVVYKEVEQLNLHAAVGMKGQFDSVTFEKDFLFDIEGLATEWAYNQTQEVLSEPIRDLNEVIHSYLMTMGYEKTMELFTNEAHIEE